MSQNEGIALHIQIYVINRLASFKNIADYIMWVKVDKFGELKQFRYPPGMGIKSFIAGGGF